MITVHSINDDGSKVDASGTVHVMAGDAVMGSIEFTKTEAPAKSRRRKRRPPERTTDLRFLYPPYSEREKILLDHIKEQAALLVGLRGRAGGDSRERPSLASTGVTAE